jgi:hypothetical protein
MHRPFEVCIYSLRRWDLWWGRWDVFARVDRESAWFWERGLEEKPRHGWLQLGMGHWKLTVSWFLPEATV